MPIYEYRCNDCDGVFEMLQKNTESRSGITRPQRSRLRGGRACPKCGSKRTARLFSRFGFKSGQVSRGSTGGGSCAACRPSPGQCGTCGGH